MIHDEKTSFGPYQPPHYPPRCTPHCQLPLIHFRILATLATTSQWWWRRASTHQPLRGAPCGTEWKGLESDTGNYEHITDGNKPNFSQSQTSQVQLFLGHAWNMLEFAEWNLVVTAAAICKHQDLFCFTEFHCLALEQKPRCLQFAL